MHHSWARSFIDDFQQLSPARVWDQIPALLWKKLGLSYTPSFHYVHKEDLRHLAMHGGFEELVEDHIEQSQQKMDRVHQRLARLGFGIKRDWQRWQIIQS
jgi:hypothetical protein